MRSIFLTIKIDEWWTDWYCTVLQRVKNVFVLNANNNSRDKVMTALRNVSLCTFFYCHYFIMWYLYLYCGTFFFSLNATTEHRTNMSTNVSNHLFGGCLFVLYVNHSAYTGYHKEFGGCFFIVHFHTLYHLNEYWTHLNSQPYCVSSSKFSHYE